MCYNDAKKRYSRSHTALCLKSEGISCQAVVRHVGLSDVQAAEASAHGYVGDHVKRVLTEGNLIFFLQLPQPTILIQHDFGGYQIVPHTCGISIPWYAVHYNRGHHIFKIFHVSIYDVHINAIF